MKKNYAPIRVLLADDHEIFREGFDTLLKKQEEFLLAGEATDGYELLRQAEKLRPDVILTDIRMPGLDGVEATRNLQVQLPQIPVVALTMFDDEKLIVEMLSAGARGYLLKNAHKSEVFAAIRAVHRQERYYCRSTTTQLARLIATSSLPAEPSKAAIRFTTREMEIIRLTCREYSSKEMAQELHISVRTVEGYREKIQQKMKVRNTAGMVVYAIRNGIFPL